MSLLVINSHVCTNEPIVNIFRVIFYVASLTLKRLFCACWSIYLSSRPCQVSRFYSMEDFTLCNAFLGVQAKHSVERIPASVHLWLFVFNVHTNWRTFRSVISWKLNHIYNRIIFYRCTAILYFSSVLLAMWSSSNLFWCSPFEVKRTSFARLLLSFSWDYVEIIVAFIHINFVRAFSWCALLSLIWERALILGLVR